MPIMVRERRSCARRLFIEVTPGLRRALEVLATVSADLLDEIDTPADTLDDDAAYPASVFGGEP